MSFASAADTIAGLRRSAFTVEPLLPIDEWADQHRWVMTADGLVRWRTDLVPYLREPMRAIDTAEAVVLMCGSQLGKTECIINAILRGLDQRPGTAMLTLSTQDQAEKVVKDRVCVAVRETPRLMERVRNPRLDLTYKQVTVGLGTLRAAWYNSTAQAKSTPVRELYMDELDEAEDGVLEMFEERLKAQGGRTIKVMTSTPTAAGHGIDAMFHRGDRRRYWVPCPHCNGYQTLEWKHLHWGDDENRGLKCSPQMAAETARYVCRHCGGEIRNHHKRQMLRRGAWAPEGCEVVGKEDGTAAIVGEPVSDSAIASYHLSSLYSPFAGATFGKMAEAFVAGGGMTPQFVNGWLGEAWQVAGESVESHDLRTIIRPAHEPGGYRSGSEQLPRGVAALLAGVDVQGDRLRYVVRGIAANLRDRWLIDEGWINCPRGSGLAVLDQLAARRWKSDAGTPVGVQRIVIDSGHRTDEVYSQCIASGGLCVPVKGHAGTQRPEPSWTTHLHRVHPKLYLVNVNVDYYKTQLYGAITHQLGRASRVLIDSPEPSMRLHWPADVSGEYLDELTSEHLTQRRKGQRVGRKQAGRSTSPQTLYEWHLRPGRTENHALDCEVYLAAILDRVRR